MTGGSVPPLKNIRFSAYERLDQTRLLQRRVRAATLHRLEALGGDRYRYLFVEFGEKDRLLLHIDLAAALANRIELGRTRAVRIPATDAGALSCYVACTCHSPHILRHIA